MTPRHEPDPRDEPPHTSDDKTTEFTRRIPHQEARPSRPQHDPVSPPPAEEPWWQQIYKRSDVDPRRTPNLSQPGWPSRGQQVTPPPPQPPRHQPPSSSRAAPPPPRTRVYPAPVSRPPIPPHGRSSSAPPEAASTQPPRTLRLVLIGASVIAIVALAAAVALRFGTTTSAKQLDVAKAQQGVAQVLSDPINGYGAEHVSQVSCNGGTNPPVIDGRTFTCQAVIDGDPYDVTVTFKGEDGTYEVDWPR